MAKDRIYFVGPVPAPAGDGATDQNAPRTRPRLVRATHPRTALMYAARDAFAVRVATQNDLEALIAKGIKVEDATEA